MKYDFKGTDFWEKKKVIGRGGSSTVYEAVILHNSETIAAKEIQIDGLTKAQVKGMTYRYNIYHCNTTHVFHISSINIVIILSFIHTVRPTAIFYCHLMYQSICPHLQVLAIEAEVSTIKSLDHRHIVNYLGTQLIDNHFYIFLEHADYGSLRQYYRSHGKLEEKQVGYIATCLTQH